MVQTDAAGTTRGGAGILMWIFRILVVAGGAFMLYTWFQQWWSADIAVIPGKPDMVLHPWGIEAVAQVRANADVSSFEMPWFFAPLMWAYIALCMLALAVSLFWKRRISLGRISVAVATLLIALVGLSYMAALGIAYAIGTLRAGWAGAKFIGKSTIPTAMSDAGVKMVSQLEQGYWLALGAGGALTILAIISIFIIRKPKI